MKNCIIISASSDIGIYLCKSWSEKGWNLFGTFRKKTKQVIDLTKIYNVKLFNLDISEKQSIQTFFKKLSNSIDSWDVLVFCTGTMNPIGDFQNTDFDQWEKSIHINFINQLRILNLLLPSRNKNILFPTVLFFAGGGTNNAVINYSSYIISKIALTKMCELLDAEIPDVRFNIVGPGWVKTKIHNETINSDISKNSDNYNKTLEKFKNNDFVDVKKVIECCTWLVSCKSKAINGRNFSVEFDKWGDNKLLQELEKDKDMYKLRRHNNNWK